jgi:hypothetical protein
LRALVLHLVPALAVTWLGLDMRAAARPRRLLDADAQWRVGRGSRLEAAERLQHLVAIGLQRVHPEIDGSAPRQRRPLLARPRAEGSAELRLEPFRIVAPHMRGRVGGDLSP